MKLTKMNLYRLWKMPSTYIILGALLAFCCLAFTIMFGSGQSSNEFFGVTSNVTSYYEYFVSGDILALFVTIVSGIFVYSEIANGSIKNIYGKETKKYKLTISKTFAITSFIIATLSEIFFISIIANKIHDNNISLGTTYIHIIKYTFIHLLLLTAFSSIIICLGTISRNNVLTLVIGIMYCTWGYSIESFIDSKIQKLEGFSDFILSSYTVMGNLKTITLNAASDDYYRAIIVSLIMIFATNLTTHYYLKKADVH